MRCEDILKDVTLFSKRKKCPVSGPVSLTLRACIFLGIIFRKLCTYIKMRPVIYSRPAADPTSTSLAPMRQFIIIITMA